ncbi:hypothetical protein LTS18_000494, partial [Coniosporium uncinatum]
MKPSRALLGAFEDDGYDDEHTRSSPHSVRRTPSREAGIQEEDTGEDLFLDLAENSPQQDDEKKASAERKQ